MESTFIHLHNHSEFSILDGAFKTKNLVKAAFDLKMPAVALTDHGNIFGAVKFYKEAKEKKIKPIIGCEVYITPGKRTERKQDGSRPLLFHLVLLVKNELGYKNLCQLITKSYLEGFYYRPRIDKEILAQYSGGLIGLSACLRGEVTHYLGLDLDEKAEQAAREYRSLLPDNQFYIEIQDHGLPLQKKVRPKLIALAKKLGLPLIASNDVHYLKKEDAESHDVLLCIQTNKKVNEEERIRFGTQEFYFKSAEEMGELFSDVPEAITNSLTIASQCDFDFPTSKYFLPNFIAPKDRNIADYFEEVVWEGFEELMLKLEKRISNNELPSREEYEIRLKKEIELVKKMGFEGYFLIVWDLIKNAREKKIPVGPGRGSAAGSLLAFCLKITTIDPLEYDLLFERFLNPERISLPDIDIDFCGRRRDEVIEYVNNKYGSENVCQIITFGTMAARGSVRDVGRALEVPLPEVDKIAKMIPFSPDATIANALKTVSALKDIRNNDPKIANLLSIAQKLEGQVRHPSIHAAGTVITPRPLVEFLPLYRSAKGEVTTQFPMQEVETIGLLKMDLLGLRNLTVIRDTLEMIKKDLGEKIEIENIALDDEKTFVLFQNGNTEGVFQFESSGMKDLLRKYKPENFRDLIALNALYRPGPLKSGMTDEFVKCKNHPDRIKYEFPGLEPILKETKGVIVYQEQVMRIATDIAGFSMAEADILRKAMGKKITSVMKARQDRFVKGAKLRGVNSSKANKIFGQIKYFAGYGFNKSHSAAYAYLAYQTAYLKSHYPLYFLSALLTSEAERGSTNQVIKYKNECKNMGIEILVPDINKSDYEFIVEKENIRFGLAAIKNIGENSILSILKERKKQKGFSHPFDILKDLSSKVINRKVLENLIKAGAFDSLGWKRSQLFHLVDQMIDHSHELQKLKLSKQNLLFADRQSLVPAIPAEVKRMSEWEESLLLAYEKEALGFYLTGHPLTQYGDRLKKLVSHQLSDLDEEKDFNKEIRVAGVITSLKLIKTKKEERMASFFLEDLSSRIDVVVFPDAYKAYYETLVDDQMVWIKGKFLGEGENRRIQLTRIMPLVEALEKQIKKIIVKIFLPGIEKSTFESLKNLLFKFEGDCPIFFELETPHSSCVMMRSIEVHGIDPTEVMIKEIEGLLGENSVQIEY